MPDQNIGYGGQLIHIMVTLSGSEEYRNGPITAAIPFPAIPLVDRRGYIMISFSLLYMRRGTYNLTSA